MDLLALPHEILISIIIHLPIIDENGAPALRSLSHTCWGLNSLVRDPTTLTAIAKAHIPMLNRLLSNDSYTFGILNSLASGVIPIKKSQDAIEEAWCPLRISNMAGWLNVIDIGLTCSIWYSDSFRSLFRPSGDGSRLDSQRNFFPSNVPWPHTAAMLFAAQQLHTMRLNHFHHHIGACPDHPGHICEMGSSFGRFKFISLMLIADRPATGIFLTSWTPLMDLEIDGSSIDLDEILERICNISIKMGQELKTTPTIPDTFWDADMYIDTCSNLVNVKDDSTRQDLSHFSERTLADLGFNTQGRALIQRLGSDE